jgi:hydrogenase expression/formation protein
MMDLGYAKRGLRKGDSKLLEKLADRILEIKSISRESAEKLASAVITEAKATLDIKDDIIAIQSCGVTMGEFGVGSRGRGDFYAHKKIAEVIGKTDSACDSSQMDDSGVYGTAASSWSSPSTACTPASPTFLCRVPRHPRLLRDLYVMGAKLGAVIRYPRRRRRRRVKISTTRPASPQSQTRYACVTTGSTLRIGGDMVTGERLTGWVGAVGVGE